MKHFVVFDNYAVKLFPDVKDVKKVKIVVQNIYIVLIKVVL